MNTLANTLVVGSRCIPELKRRPKDLDVITTQAGFDEMVARAGLYDQLKEIRETRTGKAAIFGKSIIDAEIVEQEWGKVLSNLRQALLAIPSKIAQAVSNAKDAAEAEEIIRAQIYEALNELSAGQVSESD